MNKSIKGNHQPLGRADSSAHQRSFAQPPKANFSRRLSLLLNSLCQFHQQTEQQENAFFRQYLRKTIDNHGKMKQSKSTLSRESRNIWREAIQEASRARNTGDLEKAYCKANRAVRVRTRLQKMTKMQECGENFFSL